LHQVTQAHNYKEDCIEYAAVNKKEILSEANRLVSNGLRKAAIDLLLEYLEADPNSSTVLSTLGRAYLLDQQPEKAVVYLKKSLELDQAVNPAVNDSSEYQANNFGDEDMAYIDSQACQLSEEEYRLEGEGTTLPAEGTTINETLNGSILFGIDQDKPKTLTAPEDAQEKTFQSASNNVDEVSSHENNIVEKTPLSVSQQNPLPPCDTDSAETDVTDSYPTAKTTKHPIIKIVDGNNWVDEEEIELAHGEQKISDDLFSDEEDEEYGGLADESLTLTSHSYPEEDCDELSCDGFEDIDDFDELICRQASEEVQDEGSIDREHRAQQIAIEVLEKSDWDPIHLPLLQQVFIENGWSAARVAIEREIENGLSPDELALARKIRLYWSENERYWITFHRIQRNTSYEQTDAIYRNMSWPEALRIIHCFPSLPDIEEIYRFIDDEFDRWYESDRLRGSFRAFFKFIKFRINSMRRTFPCSCEFLISDEPDLEFEVDSPGSYNVIEPTSQRLQDLSIQLDQWPRPPENKMTVILEFSK
jgi:tetratricopeptide (TPR) repeat protein